MLGPQGHRGAGQEVSFLATRCLSRLKPSCPIRPPENCHSVPATPQECTCHALSSLVISAVTPLSCLSLHLPLSLPGSSSVTQLCTGIPDVLVAHCPHWAELSSRTPCVPSPHRRTWGSPQVSERISRGLCDEQGHPNSKQHISRGDRGYFPAQQKLGA